ncbi:hypothetical protein ACIBH1_37540 [Nonomuraea sp. NPDC050663]|uniref:hypothetical protein n=1 Tax=Nonomuraea sp. NPDC050663 TaxID=3364370 RepID=UPI0037A0674F
MRIKLPAAITQAKGEHQTGSPHRRDQPARDLKPTGQANLSRRPTAAPRRGGY